MEEKKKKKTPNRFFSRGVNMVKVRIKALEHLRGPGPPPLSDTGIGGMDLPAALPIGRSGHAAARHWQLIPTGLAIALPEAMRRKSAPRSGLPRNSVFPASTRRARSTPDYRGEIHVNLINHGARALRGEARRAHRH